MKIYSIPSVALHQLRIQSTISSVPRPVQSCYTSVLCYCHDEEHPPPLLVRIGPDGGAGGGQGGGGLGGGVEPCLGGETSV